MSFSDISAALVNEVNRREELIELHPVAGWSSHYLEFGAVSVSAGSDEILSCLLKCLPRKDWNRSMYT